MKVLRIFFLLCFAIAAGCSQPSGSTGDANDPATTSDMEQMDNVDEAAEAAADGAATGADTATEEAAPSDAEE
jgi:hypothetical protein